MPQVTTIHTPRKSHCPNHIAKVLVNRFAYRGTKQGLLVVVASKGQHWKGEEEHAKLNEGPDSVKKYKEAATVEGPSYTKGMVQIQAWMESAEEDTENRLGPDQGKKKEKAICIWQRAAEENIWICQGSDARFGRPEFSAPRPSVMFSVSDFKAVMALPSTYLQSVAVSLRGGFAYGIYELLMLDFVYQKSMQFANNLKLPTNCLGCQCKGGCSNPTACACAQLNGNDFPYVQRDGGRSADWERMLLPPRFAEDVGEALHCVNIAKTGERKRKLIEAKSVVFECGPNCGCNVSCVNRISQQGIKYHLEVFRTPSKGWGVRSWDTIPSGAPICEYTGILTKTDDMDNIADNSYIFEIDCLQTMKGLDGRETRPGDVSSLINLDDKRSEVVEYCIDAGSVGNVARFINHSCQPNLFVQCILSSHHDMKMAKVMLFAADTIPPLEELTYDYGYALDSVVGADGKVVKMPCHCGAVDCRKWLY
ncbi:hypothetical protein ZIOFF_063613 [Zingiber officinale]|uniref:Uncharacterized protein n=1 Tax=Zingiber officinale TaxID=94328 RepID=A0A8J5F596_ZINOF|nr:hypothetical protein ZIOFF_063613 [Zingiber officinale]